MLRPARSWLIKEDVKNDRNAACTACRVVLMHVDACPGIVFIIVEACRGRVDGPSRAVEGCRGAVDGPSRGCRGAVEGLSRLTGGLRDFLIAVAIFPNSGNQGACRGRVEAESKPVEAMSRGCLSRSRQSRGLSRPCRAECRWVWGGSRVVSVRCRVMYGGCGACAGVRCGRRCGYISPACA